MCIYIDNWHVEKFIRLYFGGRMPLQMSFLFVLGRKGSVKRLFAGLPNPIEGKEINEWTSTAI